MFAFIAVAGAALLTAYPTVSDAGDLGTRPLPTGATSSGRAVRAVAESRAGPGSIRIIPKSGVEVSNCIPFGDNTDFGFTGFIYRDVAPFILPRGDTFSFDLGAMNDRAVRRDIYFAIANKDPTASAGHLGDQISQGVRAERWVQVASESQLPENPRGDTIAGNYELTYRAEHQFRFTGGGFIVGFSGAPPATFRDDSCTQVLVATTAADASGHFYARFCFKPEQTLAVLDRPGHCKGTAFELGGIVIRGVRLPRTTSPS